MALDVQQGVSVSGSAAADTVHLLAELLDNATTFSPRTTQVVVSGRSARDGGSLISITDAGTGIAREQLGQLNWRLAHPRLPDTTVGQRMGFFAVAHLAARHGISVTLGTPQDGGTRAEVHLPASLISPEVRPPAWMGPADEVLRCAAGGRARRTSRGRRSAAHRSAVRRGTRARPPARPGARPGVHLCARPAARPGAAARVSPVTRSLGLAWH